MAIARAIQVRALIVSRGGHFLPGTHKDRPGPESGSLIDSGEMGKSVMHPPEFKRDTARRGELGFR